MPSGAVFADTQAQVSTTVFQAALWSGVDIVERHLHSGWLPWYDDDASLGIDALKVVGGPDLKFHNKTSAHMLLKVTNSLEQTRQTVVEYGRTVDRRDKFERGAGNLQFQLQRRVLAGGEALGEDLSTSVYIQ